MRPRAELADKGDGDFMPSDEACKFCRAKEVCRARADHNLALFDDAPDIILMTVGEAAELLASRPCGIRSVP